MKPDKIEFIQNYSDDSDGVQFKVEFDYNKTADDADYGVISIYQGNSRCDFPLRKVSWLREIFEHIEEEYLC